MPCLPSTSQDNNHHQQIATIETRTESIPIPIVTCDFASDVSTSEAAEMESNQNYEKDTLKVCSMVSTTNLPIGSAAASSGLKATNGSSSPSNELKVSPTFNRCRALSVGIDNDMVSEFDPSSSDSGVISRCAVVKPLKFRLCQPIFGKRNHHKSVDNATKIQHNKHHMVESTELEPAIPKVQKQRDPEKEKRRIAVSIFFSCSFYIQKYPKGKCLNCENVPQLPRNNRYRLVFSSHLFVFRLLAKERKTRHTHTRFDYGFVHW